MAKIYLFIYAALLLSGAYFGKKSGSNVSMVMGLLSGISVLVFLFIHYQAPVIGRNGLLIISVCLSIVFLKRLLVTMTLMPAGMLLAASMLAVAASFLLVRH